MYFTIFAKHLKILSSRDFLKCITMKEAMDVPKLHLGKQKNDFVAIDLLEFYQWEQFNIFNL